VASVRALCYFYQSINSEVFIILGLASQAFMMKFLCAMPSHWIILYDSDEMGLGTNRFLHHVLAYKGPTLCLIKTEEGSVFCIASPNEWKESHLYWGGEDSALFQLFPRFCVCLR
jgi:TLD